MLCGRWGMEPLLERFWRELRGGPYYEVWMREVGFVRELGSMGLDDDIGQGTRGQWAWGRCNGRGQLEECLSFWPQARRDHELQQTSTLQLVGQKLASCCYIF